MGKGLTTMEHGSNRTGDTAIRGLTHGRRSLLDADPGLAGPAGPLDGLRGPGGGPVGAVPQGGSTLSGGSVPVLGQRGALGGLPDNPRAASVLRAIVGFMARQKAGPGRARRRGGRGAGGGRGGPQTVKSAPETAPLFREPAFSASHAGCSSPYRTPQPIRGQAGRRGQAPLSTPKGAGIESQ